MHNFNADSFVALSPAKAKSQALAMFTDAHASPSPDWYGVALALHSVVTRGKRIKVESDIAMEDSADAGEFIAWADYPLTGKATSIARGLIRVTFADGWTRTVNVLASKTAKGRKPWLIAGAVRFAVDCYKLAATRRATGCDDAMYFHRTGNVTGLSVTLDGLISAPEIVSIVSADSAETVEGDLIWNPEEANCFTRDQRAGAVAVPLMLAPMPQGIADAVKSARTDLIGRMGLQRSPMHALAKEAAERVEALLYSGGSMAPEFEASAELFQIVWSDRENYPESDAAISERDARITAAFEEESATDAPADNEPGLFGDAETVEPADHETMLLAGEIVGDIADPDAFAESLCLPYVARFTLVEDALLAWPALAMPCVAVDGVAVEIVASQGDADAPANDDAMEPADAAPMVESYDDEDGAEAAACLSPAALVDAAAEAAALADGWSIGAHGKWHNPARNNGAAYTDTPRAFRYICEDHGLLVEAAGEPVALVEPVAAPVVAEEPAKPASKPRYSVGADGKWVLLS